jgi:hypothetical protein
MFRVISQSYKGIKDMKGGFMQGICTDLFYDDFVADCTCEHCKQYRADTLRLNSVVFPSDELPY